MKNAGLFVLLVATLGSSNVAHAGDKSTILGLGGKCLDVRGGSRAWETPVQIWSCNGGGAQVWEQTAVGELRGLGGLCLDVKNGSTAWGTPVQTYPCTGNAAQKWDVRSDGSIRGLGALCLDVRNGDASDGTQVQMYPCTGNAAQKWSLSPLCAYHFDLGPLQAKWDALGADKSWLGCQRGAPTEIFSLLWMAVFDRGVILQRNGTKAVAIERHIFDAWSGSYRYTGVPYEDSFAVVRGGWYSSMTEGGAAILWSPETGAQVVRGGIRARYDRDGGPGGYLGFPRENSHDPDSLHGWQRFQGGTICWYGNTNWLDWLFSNNNEHTTVVGPTGNCAGMDMPTCSNAQTYPFCCYSLSGTRFTVTSDARCTEDQAHENVLRTKCAGAAVYGSCSGAAPACGGARPVPKNWCCCRAGFSTTGVGCSADEADKDAKGRYMCPGEDWTDLGEQVACPFSCMPRFP